MATGLSPTMNNLNLNLNFNEDFWDDLFHLHRSLLSAIPVKNNIRNIWKDKCKSFHSKYTKRTDA